MTASVRGSEVNELIRQAKVRETVICRVCGYSPLLPFPSTTIELILLLHM